jgi:2-polyprenyl-3-methyl-5-hydroxy-6-metoxy-1,4-benzoquinol methylase
VDDLIIRKLINLNRTFYQTFTTQFSATRQRLQPGVLRVFDQISNQDHILDLGCGNGELARELTSRKHQGEYLGVDSNPGFIELARDQLPSSSAITFLERDLTNPDWDHNLPIERFDLVFAFAVLHHIPGTALREQILTKVWGLIVPNGHFIHSEWQFLNSTRLKARIQPWEKIGLNSDQVDPGDYLLDWRHGGFGLRYVHLFANSELESMAKRAGFEIIDSFSSDGDGGNLGLYQFWKRV